MATDIKYDTVEIKPGERIDHLANRLLGNSQSYQKLLEINSGLNVWDPKPGQIINIPNVK